jgi:ABC-type nickel/cobalt efflux system permease component RcnA
MNHETLVLAGTAATIGFVHTVLGPDHYLPFVAMSKARDWSAAKTGLVTFVCGVGHVLSSVLLGFIGLFIGIFVFQLESIDEVREALQLESIESFRGGLAGWLLLAFGLAYMAWGIRRAVRNRPHEHRHEHDDAAHAHEHDHLGDHSHVHSKAGRRNITPWVLFTIFVFGPCEPLIPLLIYPAAKLSIGATVLVAGVFAVVTISTMLACVMVAYYGLARVRFGGLERYAHALAGLTILLCGVAITFLDL